MLRWAFNIGPNVTEDDVQRMHDPHGDRKLIIKNPHPVAGYEVDQLRAMGIRGVWEEVDEDGEENV